MMMTVPLHIMPRPSSRYSMVSLHMHTDENIRYKCTTRVATISMCMVLCVRRGGRGVLDCRVCFAGEGKGKINVPVRSCQQMPDTPPPSPVQASRMDWPITQRYDPRRN